MDANAYLAEKLMGWDDNQYFRSSGEPGLSYWHPDEHDAQADMVVREIAKLGYRWIIRTYREGKVVRHGVALYGGVDRDCIYRECKVPNRNEHIVAAAVKALEAEEPEPHRCKWMPDRAEWRKPCKGWWAYYVRDEFKVDARFCHKCGADLNE